MKKKILNMILILIICISCVFAADANGIWHLAEDVRPGIFGSDENVGDFFFENSSVGIGTTLITSGYKFVVAGNANIDGNIDITGNTNIDGGVNIEGNTNIGSNVNVKGDANFSKGINIGSSANIKENLIVNDISSDEIYVYKIYDSNSVKTGFDHYIDPSDKSSLEKLEIHDTLESDSINVISSLTIDDEDVATKEYVDLEIESINFTETDGSISNELPVAGTGIVISGDESRTVSVDNNIVPMYYTKMAECRIADNSDGCKVSTQCNGKDLMISFRFACHMERSVDISDSIVNNLDWGEYNIYVANDRNWGTQYCIGTHYLASGGSEKFTSTKIFTGGSDYSSFTYIGGPSFEFSCAEYDKGNRGDCSVKGEILCLSLP